MDGHEFGKRCCNHLGSEKDSKWWPEPSHENHEGFIGRTVSFHEQGNHNYDTWAYYPVPVSRPTSKPHESFFTKETPIHTDATPPPNSPTRLIHTLSHAQSYTLIKSKLHTRSGTRCPRTEADTSSTMAKHADLSIRCGKTNRLFSPLPSRRLLGTGGNQVKSSERKR